MTPEIQCISFWSVTKWYANTRKILYANVVLPGGMTICFQSVTECDADTCENLYAVVPSRSVMKCDADTCKNLQVNVVFPRWHYDRLPDYGPLHSHATDWWSCAEARSHWTMTGLSLAVSDLGQLTLSVAPSMTDCWMRHLPRIAVHGARSFGVACPCKQWTPVLHKIFDKSGRSVCHFGLSLVVLLLPGLPLWRVWTQKMVLVCKVLKNLVWCGLHVEFLVGLKRTSS